MPRRFMPSRLRLAELLALEEKLARPGSDVALDDQLYQKEPQAAHVAVPMGNSPCIGLATRCRLHRLAALWGGNGAKEGQ